MVKVIYDSPEHHEQTAGRFDCNPRATWELPYGKAYVWFENDICKFVPMVTDGQDIYVLRQFEEDDLNRAVLITAWAASELYHTGSEPISLPEYLR